MMNELSLSLGMLPALTYVSGMYPQFHRRCRWIRTLDQHLRKCWETSTFSVQETGQIPGKLRLSCADDRSTRTRSRRSETLFLRRGDLLAVSACVGNIKNGDASLIEPITA
jgi:hypothetical protein